MRRHQQNSPMRRCIGCYKSFPHEELIRFTETCGNIIVDTTSKNEGRGFYLCRNNECIELAIKKKAFSRICKKNVDPKSIREVAMTAIGNTKEEQNV